MTSLPPAKVAAAAYRQVLKHVTLASSYNEFTSKLSKSPDVLETPIAEKHYDQDGNIIKKTRIAVKDNIATTDLPTTCSSSILADYVSPFPADVISSLAETYTTTSKTNMDEFGMGSHSINSAFGPVLNPSSPSISAGGSSGGSAAAVASGEYKAALGTDTGGSVRLPAAYTGITGFKPSYGRISRWGVVPYANSLDTVGILTDSPRSAQNVLFEAEDKRRFHEQNKDPTSISGASWTRMNTRARRSRIKPCAHFRHRCQKLRIGVPIEYNIESLTPIVKEEWIRILETMRIEGHTLVPISLPNTRHALSAYYIIAAAEASSNLAKYDNVRYGAHTLVSGSSDTQGPNDVLYAQTRGRNFGEEVRRRILLGSFALSSEAMDNYFLQAQRVRALVQRDFDRVFAEANPLHSDRQFDLSEMSEEEVAMENKLGPAQVDVILVPTAPTTPPTLEEVEKQGETEGWANDVFTIPASMAGLPACSVPMRNPDRAKGENIGMQVIGQYFMDSQVLKAAHEVIRCNRLVVEGKVRADNENENETGTAQPIMEGEKELPIRKVITTAPFVKRFGLDPGVGEAGRVFRGALDVSLGSESRGEDREVGTKVDGGKEGGAD